MLQERIVCPLCSNSGGNSSIRRFLACAGNSIGKDSLNGEKQIKVNNAEMDRFIDEIYHEPYSLFKNNCFHKSKKIIKRAQELMLEASLVVVPISITPRHTPPYIPRILPHGFARVEGKKIDVALDPASEKIWCKNSEIISLYV